MARVFKPKTTDGIISIAKSMRKSPPKAFILFGKHEPSEPTELIVEKTSADDKIVFVKHPYQDTPKGFFEKRTQLFAGVAEDLLTGKETAMTRPLGRFTRNERERIASAILYVREISKLISPLSLEQMYNQLTYLFRQRLVIKFGNRTAEVFDALSKLMPKPLSEDTLVSTHLRALLPKTTFITLHGYDENDVMLDMSQWKIIDLDKYIEITDESLGPYIEINPESQKLALKISKAAGAKFPFKSVNDPIHSFNFFPSYGPDFVFEFFASEQMFVNYPKSERPNVALGMVVEARKSVDDIHGAGQITNENLFGRNWPKKMGFKAWSIEQAGLLQKFLDALIKIT